MKVSVFRINPKTLSIIISSLVVLSIAYGIFLSEPWQSRAVNNDMERIDDLSDIDYKIKEYWNVKRRLPLDLTELNSGSYFLSDEQKTDSDGLEYSYRIVDKDTYELCAVFNLSSDEGFFEDWRGDQWNHPEGPHCFILDDLEPFTEMVDPR